MEISGDRPDIQPALRIAYVQTTRRVPRVYGPRCGEEGGGGSTTPVSVPLPCGLYAFNKRRNLAGRQARQDLEFIAGVHEPRLDFGH